MRRFQDRCFWMEASLSTKAPAWKKPVISRNQLAKGKQPIPNTRISATGDCLPKPFPLGFEPVVPKRDSHAGQGDNDAAGKNQVGVWVRCGG